MITAAVDAGVSAGWAAADEVYGNSSVFRAHLRQHRVGYVLAASRSHMVPLDGGRSASAPTASPPNYPRPRGSAGAGSKGPRFYDCLARRCHHRRRPHTTPRPRTPAMIPNGGCRTRPLLRQSGRSRWRSTRIR
ncbi:hypothetical protein NCC78_00995 [Micromonospora phytophila]|nr:hypothetical protein [Micromonospora phytophila]MCM0673314.1 hypothetical protein [Micromonospora phytophila]